jgi:Ricin-type beta-trefoil lectin domain.
MSYCHGLGGNQVCLAFFIPFSSKVQTKIAQIYFVLLILLCIILQVFAYTKRQQIMSDDNCLDASSPEGPVKLVRCHGMGGNQAWTYSTQVFVFPLHCFCFYDCASKHIVFTQTNNIAPKLCVDILEVCSAQKVCGDFTFGTDVLCRLLSYLLYIIP